MEEKQGFGFMVNECCRKTFSFECVHQTWTLKFLSIWTEISLAEAGSVLMVDKLVNP